MKQLLFITLQILSFNLALGQVIIPKNQHQFGDLEYFNNDTAYFSIQNTSSKNIYLLSTQPSDEYLVLVSSKTIAPGETMEIGIVYFTDKKGKFSLNVPLFFSHSNEPVNFNIKGNIKNIHPNALSHCPSIENSAPLKPKQMPLTVVVKDKETGEILSHSKIKIQLNNLEITCAQPFQGNKYKCKCDYGYLRFVAESQGYDPNESFFKYDAQNFYHEIFLEKQNIIVSNQDSLKNEEKVKPKDTLRYIPVLVSKDSNIVEEELIYKPNHLIFVIDISGSMKDSIKLNFLKQSVNTLINQLRANDYMTLITYAGRSKVVFEFVNGTNKQKIMETIDTMTAKGGSYGSEALLTAYQIATQHFIPDANNQIFLATDGLFNGGKLSSEDLYKIAKKEFQKNNIKLSTIGFGNNLNALDFLQKLSKNGGGNYLTINSLPADLNILIDEVKKQSASKVIKKRY